MALRNKAINLGAHYVHGEMMDVKFHEKHSMSITDGHHSNSEQRIDSVTVSYCVLSDLQCLFMLNFLPKLVKLFNC